ncbi:hypothetical protein VP01_15039g1, partial [Puccinia sorghi]
KSTPMPKKPSPKPTQPTTKKPDIRRKTMGHLKKEDYLIIIIEWLKIKQKYNSCFGTGKAPFTGWY